MNMKSEEKEIFQQGERFLGYIIERPLGKGGLGAIYLVRHEMLDALFALKVLYTQVAQKDPSSIKRFLREARISTRIKHRNLVAVHDCGYDQERDIYYFVMDYVEGGSLREAMAFSGKMSCAEAANIVAQVASALNAAERYSLVHRDIKPENIMLQKDGAVKLVDLGIAKAVGIKDSLRTAVDVAFGTPAYISPEQALSAAEVDVRADIYSLGVVFFEMVCGTCPFVGKNPPAVLLQVMSEDPVPDVRKFNDRVPEEISHLIARMCEKKREKRIATPKNVIAELVRLGYVSNSDIAGDVEYSIQEDGDAAFENGLGFYLDDLPAECDDTLTFETKDVEIQEFVARLKRRRFLKGLLATLLPIMVLLLVWFLVMQIM